MGFLSKLDANRRLAMRVAGVESLGNTDARLYGGGEVLVVGTGILVVDSLMAPQEFIPFSKVAGAEAVGYDILVELKDKSLRRYSLSSNESLYSGPDLRTVGTAAAIAKKISLDHRTSTDVGLPSWSVGDPDPNPPIPYERISQPRAPLPRVRVSAALLMAGGVAMMLGSLLRWFTVEGVAYNGFTRDTYRVDNRFDSCRICGASDLNGLKYLLIGAFLVCTGILLFGVGRVLILAYVALVPSIVGVVMAVKNLADFSKIRSVANEFDPAAGLWVVLAGSLVGLFGAIATLIPRSTGSN